MSEPILDTKPGHPHTATQHDHGHDRNAPRSRGIHRSWIFWIAILLMLVGIGLYVRTFDLSLRPNNAPAHQPVP